MPDQYVMRNRLPRENPAGVQDNRPGIHPGYQKGYRPTLKNPERVTDYGSGFIPDPTSSGINPES
jgi:hypothetical protein